LDVPELAPVRLGELGQGLGQREHRFAGQVDDRFQVEVPAVQECEDGYRAQGGPGQGQRDPAEGGRAAQAVHAGGPLQRAHLYRLHGPPDRTAATEQISLMQLPSDIVAFTDGTPVRYETTVTAAADGLVLRRAAATIGV
jgi:hypothetical protein